MTPLTVWVVVNTSGYVWGGNAFKTEDVARSELHNFFKDKKISDKFEIREVQVLSEITGQYAGEGILTSHSKLRVSRWIP